MALEIFSINLTNQSEKRVVEVWHNKYLAMII